MNADTRHWKLYKSPARTTGRRKKIEIPARERLTRREIPPKQLRKGEYVAAYFSAEMSRHEVRREIAGI